MIGLQNCPTCGKPLDPMHAPVARIRGGKVVSFCSAACAAATPNEEAPQPRPAMPIFPWPVPAPTPASTDTAARPVVDPIRPSFHPEPPRVEVASAKGQARMASSLEYLEVEEEEEGREPRRMRRTRPARAVHGAILGVSVMVLAAGVTLVVTEVFPLGLGGGRNQESGEAAGSAKVGAPKLDTGGAAGPAATPTTGAASPTTGGGGRPATVEAPSAGAVGVGAAAAVASAPTESSPQDRRANFEAATAVLRGLMASNSPRVRRLAAQAMARTGDQDALALLRRLQREEPSQLGRIQIAYALARAGDPRARQDLHIQLGSERRDARVDAARSLLQLGDDAGRKSLRALMSVEAHRIGAAGLLARMGDEEGLKVLRDEVADKRASPEAKMRAQVALGRAGDESVRTALQRILADRRYNVGAADALAALGDDAAAPALTAQLGLSAMRVQAALWLRRLKKPVDVAPLLVALRAADEVSRVSAAEALLILEGSPTLAEHD